MQIGTRVCWFVEDADGIRQVNGTVVLVGSTYVVESPDGKIEIDPKKLYVVPRDLPL
jgi:hypothetical protein